MATKKKVKRVKKTSSTHTKSSSKMLTRSKSDKMITGVIGGIAAYFNIDSTILRLAWVAIVAFTGFVPGVLAYGVASLVMPEK